MRTSFIALLTLSILIPGCLPWMGVVAHDMASIGSVSHGLLANGHNLAKKTETLRFYRKSGRTFGVSPIVKMVKRASEQVNKMYLGSVVLVGDLSAKYGGFISGHRSHRTGRDVDIAFFITTIDSLPAPGSANVSFDSLGVGLCDNEPCKFDTPRNWELIEAILLDTEAQIQWIFVSKGVKALLLEWALINNRDISLIEKAASILHQPGDSAPHDDHFHIRIYCPTGREGAMCLDSKPLWPWKTKRSNIYSYTNDKRLMELAIGGL